MPPCTETCPFTNHYYAGSGPWGIACPVCQRRADYFPSLLAPPHFTATRSHSQPLAAIDDDEFGVPSCWFIGTAPRPAEQDAPDEGPDPDHEHEHEHEHSDSDSDCDCEREREPQSDGTLPWNQRACAKHRQNNDDRGRFW